MTNYELMFIIDPTIEDEKKEAAVETVKGIIEADGTVSEVEQCGTEESAENDHRVQTHQTALEEVPRSHSVPAVVVGIANHETRQGKEEIHCKIAMIDGLVGTTMKISFK